MEKIKCKICGKKFGSIEGLEMHNKVKHPLDNKKENKFNRKNLKRIRNWSILFAVVILIIGGISLSFSNSKTLPPTTMQGHIEENPLSHVSREPMDILVQKHMLEHADGSGPPGIIINYNCNDYSCEDGLIENLESFAEKYPTNVYVAPFPNMDAKIALTKLGRIEILEEYDEEMIEDFI